MPEHVVHAVADALNTQRKAIKGSRILILGLAYKPNVDEPARVAELRLNEIISRTRRGNNLFRNCRSPSQPVISRNLPEGNPSRETGQRLRI